MSASSRPTSMPRRSRSPVVASTRPARSRASRRRCAIATSRRSGPAFEVTKSLRSQMVFGEHDLSARVPFPRIDLLLCRNVLIYFTQPLQRVALETFAYSLRPDGRLVLGPSETVAALPGSYDEEHARLRIYRRLPGQQPVPLAWPKVVPTAREVGIPLDRAIRSTRRDAGVADRARSTGRRDPARARRRRDRGRPALRHHPHQHGRATGAGHPWHGVRPGLRPPRRCAAVDPDPQRHRVARSRARRARRSTRSNRPTSRRTPRAMSRRPSGRTARRQRRLRGGHRAGRCHADRARSRRPRPGAAAAREGGGASTSACSAPTTS